MAKRCEVRFDMPPLYGIEPTSLDPRTAERMGLSDTERDAFNRALRDEHGRYIAEMRTIYTEVTGDTKGAETLSPEAMVREIHDKSPRGAEEDARRRIAQERAGLAPPPADPAKLSAAERALRLTGRLGDTFEQRLAADIGPARAHELRTRRGGWGARMDMTGCPGGGEDDGE